MTLTYLRVHFAMFFFTRVLEVVLSFWAAFESRAREAITRWVSVSTKLAGCQVGCQVGCDVDSAAVTAVRCLSLHWAVS